MSSNEKKAYLIVSCAFVFLAILCSWENVSHPATTSNPLVFNPTL